MIAPPTAIDEDGRLAELHALGLLDTPPEERFDRITRLLSLVMRVPMAFISLVDSDRQWFKSCCGLDMAETPRAVSFCGHAILSDEPMIVPDAAEDDRFRDNPLVTGAPNIRFYAGRPLHGPGGHKVGTLCIADRRPRTLRPDEIEALGELAQIVERELGLVEVARLQRDLIAGRRHLMQELSRAAAYVRSLLPEPIDGPIRARWRFEPCSQLGGDCFGYDWIDPDHFAVYLLDVSGHGVGAALLSVSVANVLRSQSLPGVDFRDPPAVLTGLNNAFPMERHDGKYFTIWYGVFDRTSRRLAYASGGHPPALLTNGRSEPTELGVANFGIGMISDVSFQGAGVAIGPMSKLHVFSDGVYEINKADGGMMKRGELVDYLASSPGPERPDDVLRFVRQAGRAEALADDFSLVEILFT